MNFDLSRATSKTIVAIWMNVDRAVHTHISYLVQRQILCVAVADAIAYPHGQSTG